LLSKSPAGLEPRRVYRICQSFPSSAAYVLRAALVKVGRPQSEIETSVSEAAQREATRLSQLTSWLSLAAAIAPLIGLLGTVWGITQAFYDTTQMSALGTGQTRGVALANGIYVALVTTIAGLSIAIPATILAHFFENRIIKSLNEISEMTKNLIPQFERYEGQIRFNLADAESSQTDSGHSGNNHSGANPTPATHLPSVSHLPKSSTSGSHTPAS
jgi:biopolymer transport protein ExbB